MGRSTTGIHQDAKEGRWRVNKLVLGIRLQGRFDSYQAAQEYVIARSEEIRRNRMFGERPKVRFSQAAARYLLEKEKEGRPSVTTDVHLLDAVMPFIGHLELSRIHDGTLASFVRAREAEGRARKTINSSLSVVRRILNLAARAWRDPETGKTWLESAPLITLRPLVGFQREPRPITWAEQRKLLPLLPAHLGRMALFSLNTGVRDNVVCSLRWEWEVKVTDVGSVFLVPRDFVKGRRVWRAIVCNSVAQRVVDSCRGMHSELVFVWRRERIKNFETPPVMQYGPVQSMNNTAWQSARKKAGLEDLHVHDLRHTVAVRLREAGVSESSIADVLWHSKSSVTQHYARAQVLELRNALELIREESEVSNKLLLTLAAESGAGEHLRITSKSLTLKSQVAPKSLQRALAKEKGRGVTS
jgi:integrase